MLKFKAYRENGEPELLDPEPSDDFIRWVSFSEDAFNVAPQEWKTVTATFLVPETAAFGYYYALVFSRANEAVQTSERQTALKGGTAILVLLDVRVPNAKREAEVAVFSADRKMYEFLPVTFTVNLKNTGNVHVAPRGNIFISRGRQQRGGFVEVNPVRAMYCPSPPGLS